MKEQKKCPFFSICGACIIRDKIQDQKSFEILIRKKMVVNLPKWSQKFCFAGFKNCVHYQDRNQNRIKSFITRQGKKIEL